MASFAIFSRALLTTRPESSHGILCHLQPTFSNYSTGIPTRNCLTGTTNRQPTNSRSLLWTRWKSPLGCLAITASSYIACGQTTKKTPHKIPLLLHDVITGTDHKENRSSFDCWCESIAMQRPSSVDFVGPQRAHHNIKVFVSSPNNV
jgi:hypothetical protein